MLDPNPYDCFDELVRKNLIAASLDEKAVNKFADAMKDKLRKKRHEGRGDWQTCPLEDLWKMLRDHVEKGDPVDVANLACFIWNIQQMQQSQSETNND